MEYYYRVFPYLIPVLVRYANSRSRRMFENWQNKIWNFYNIIFRTKNFAKFANKNSYLLRI